MPTDLLSEFRLLLLVFLVAAAPQVGYVAYRQISEQGKPSEAAAAEAPAAKPSEPAAATAAKSHAGSHRIVCLGQADLEGASRRWPSPSRRGSLPYWSKRINMSTRARCC